MHLIHWLSPENENELYTKGDWGYGCTSHGSVGWGLGPDWPPVLRILTLRRHPGRHIRNLAGSRRQFPSKLPLPCLPMILMLSPREINVTLSIGARSSFSRELYHLRSWRGVGVLGWVLVSVCTDIGGVFIQVPEFRGKVPEVKDNGQRGSWYLQYPS